MDSYGSTPLHFAAMRANENALADLLCQRDIKIEVSETETVRMCIWVSLWVYK